MKRYLIPVLSAMGGSLTLVEVSSYIFFFHHISHHNNNVAINILKPSVIKCCNRVNAISMVGQLASWVLEVWYILVVGLLSIKFNMNMLREMSFLVKNFEFSLVPFVQILTSNPINKFVTESSFNFAKKLFKPKWFDY